MKRMLQGIVKRKKRLSLSLSPDMPAIELERRLNSTPNHCITIIGIFLISHSTYRCHPRQKHLQNRGGGDLTQTPLWTYLTPTHLGPTSKPLFSLPREINLAKAAVKERKKRKILRTPRLVIARAVCVCGLPGGCIAFSCPPGPEPRRHPHHGTITIKCQGIRRLPTHTRYADRLVSTRFKSEGTEMAQKSKLESNRHRANPRSRISLFQFQVQISVLHL
ncbi:hypothetical protein QBC35DRAFT_195583 [Podospora australis]|uniref:Uncharacterized protein n=1 Tax=Podospora australis TaxID=1536484 RepID=A0AAN7AJ05_9PEZI|nr:hypothetical protein QBC35DRAFT_195583 [Podospora australis]